MCDEQQSPQSLRRRSLLRAAGALAVAPSALALTALPTQAAASTYIGSGSYRVHTTKRTGYRAYGQGHIGTHTGPYQWGYNDGFLPICNAWADTYGSVLLFMTGGQTKAAWFGCITVYGGTGSSNHVQGNAFDVTAVYHTNGAFVDCNYSHFAHAGVTHNRRYAGLAWSARKHMPEVGIVGTQSSHSNHIHAGRYKNGSASLLLTKTTWDAYLVQYSCKAFMGVPIAIDGAWGPQTTSYYNELVRRLGLSARNPFGVTKDAQDLAHMLAAYGVVGAAI
jgi:hypothetical protein